MSVVSRVVLAGLVCASLGSVQAFPTIARAQSAKPSGGDEQSSDTRGRFVHASKCVMTFGFTSGCDKDAPAPKAADRPAPARVADDGSTKSQFLRASKCVVTFGFTSGCDKDEPAPKVAPKAADREAVTKAAIDSTRSQFFRASRCVVSLGFVGDCDKNAPAGGAQAPSPAASSQRADAAPAAAAAPDTSTRGQFVRASKCVATFGLVGGCDKDKK